MAILKQKGDLIPILYPQILGLLVEQDEALTQDILDTLKQFLDVESNVNEEEMKTGYPMTAMASLGIRIGAVVSDLSKLVLKSVFSLEGIFLSMEETKYCAYTIIYYRPA